MLFLYEILSRQTAYGHRVGSTVVPRNGMLKGDVETFWMDGHVLRLSQSVGCVSVRLSGLTEDSAHDLDTLSQVKEEGTKSGDCESLVGTGSGSSKIFSMFPTT